MCGGVGIYNFKQNGVWVRFKGSKGSSHVYYLYLKKKQFQWEKQRAKVIMAEVCLASPRYTKETWCLKQSEQGKEQQINYRDIIVL